MVGVAVRAVGECVECRFLRPRLDFFIGRIGTAGQAQVGIIGQHGAGFGNAAQSGNFGVDLRRVVGFGLTAVSGQVGVVPA